MSAAVPEVRSHSNVEGLTHEEFMALSGLAPLPPVPVSTKPLPMVFSAAVAAVVACRSIDEAKYWDNKADALAAWAKIYADDAVAREARALKLFAYRRMGSLAEQIRGAHGSGGAEAVLRENGFRATQARYISRVSRVPEIEFQDAIRSPRPPSPSTLVAATFRVNKTWAEYSGRLNTYLSIARRTDPDELVGSMDQAERTRAVRLVGELIAHADLLHECLHLPTKERTA